MGAETFLVDASRLFAGALSTFLAIILWSKTRDTGWILIIIATLVSYTEIVFTTLKDFGVIDETSFSMSGIPVVRIILLNLPLILSSLAFIIVIARRRYP